MSREDKILAFIDKLAAFDKLIDETSGKKCENIYADDSFKKENLTKYLLYLDKANPRFMLVGEAPGYNGCGKSGIAFTDLFQICCDENNGNDNSRLLGEWVKEMRLDLTNEKPEMSASIIWEVLSKHKGAVPLIWNIFPFHPYKGDDILTNRKPIAAEIKIGKEFLNKLADIYDINQDDIYAVGGTASKALGIKDADHMIRHPAYGGKSKCQCQLQHIVLPKYM